MHLMCFFLIQDCKGATISLDIKYRPTNYDDVLGQASTITILREYVNSGKGFRQSYLFCGGHGGGKTTLGRILARALLCEDPVDGNPCNKCTSCTSLLEHGTSADFIEVDAATNSGKADVQKIIDEIAYSTFSGKRRIYLFDESHQLSKDALDALLKPLEDCLPDSEDKRLTCIFCTTEPEKMRATVLSRCAPAFVVQPQTPDTIGERLAYICKEEGIEAEGELLTLIAEITECHIRDALKAVEGVSMLGAVNKANVSAYLHLDLNSAYLDILDAIGEDLQGALKSAQEILKRASPLTCYEKLANVSMLAFGSVYGGAVPAYWGKERLTALGARKQHQLLGYAARFASRPGRPSDSMLMMDIAHLHHVGGSVTDPTAVLQVQGLAGVGPSVPSRPELSDQSTARQAVSQRKDPPVQDSKIFSGTVSPQDEAWINALHGKAASSKQDAVVGKAKERKSSALLDPLTFGKMLASALADGASRSGRHSR